LSIDDVKNRVLNCKKCEEMNSGQRRVPGVGVLDPLVFILGEAPGRLGADKTGVPFTQDRSGRLLENMMRMIGLSPQRNVYISNIVKCNPRTESGKNRRPSMKEIENCKEYLVAELNTVRPQVILPLGELASKQVLGVGQRFCEIVGHVKTDSFNRPILPLYHPSYVIRGSYSIHCYRQDFQRLGRLLNTKALRSS
jgi:DNA polymerase